MDRPISETHFNCLVEIVKQEKTKQEEMDDMICACQKASGQRYIEADINVMQVVVSATTTKLMRLKTLFLSRNFRYYLKENLVNLIEIQSLW